MSDIDFRRIAPRLGSPENAFEELCCQIARRSLPRDVDFVRLRGAGGDGGVESFTRYPGGEKRGWQAKYVFDFQSFLKQAGDSLKVALRIHTDLVHYTLCCPFDLTGPTGRKGRSQFEKYEDWRREQEARAAKAGRQLKVELWTASDLRGQLLAIDTSGGIRQFFFDETILTEEWFEQHLTAAFRTAGPRYTPHLNVCTLASQWFDAFGRGEQWQASLIEHVRTITKAIDRMAKAVERTTDSGWGPAWPDDLREGGRTTVTRLREALKSAASLPTKRGGEQIRIVVTELRATKRQLAPIQDNLVARLEEEHGRGTALSPGFRQFMAEYMVSFPTANLDHVRQVNDTLGEFLSWLEAPEGFLALEDAFILTGDAGVGKTHSICDAARLRLKHGALSIVLFGNQFGGEPDPWTRLRDRLGLPPTLSRDAVLDLFGSAAEASGQSLVLFLDALNETKPLRYWRAHLSEFVEQICARPHLKLCVSCRSSYDAAVLPDGCDLPRVNHQGFQGVEREACRSFFEHYGLEPPVAPTLRPELANPLYLRLVCETMKARGLTQLPAGWQGLATAIAAFFEEKERRLAEEFDRLPGARIVRGAMASVVEEIVDRGLTGIYWSKAQAAVESAVPQARGLPVLEWLIREDLLIEDAPEGTEPFGDEATIRPSFERLGDHLLAAGVLDRVDQNNLNAAVLPGGVLHRFVEGNEATDQHAGIVAALSIQFPEGVGCGRELADLLQPGPARDEVVRLSIAALPWRDPTQIREHTRSLIEEALRLPDMASEVFDAILSLAWQPSVIDALWLNRLLRRRPLVRRDAFWCGYLYQRYEEKGPVDKLIQSAFEFDAERLTPDIAERWATILLWFTAAADRRVKDRATRAVTAVLTARPKLIPNVLQRMLDSGDDEVQERALLSCYSALIVSRDADVVRMVTRTLHTAFRSDPAAFDNALIRDHIRCITELARMLDALPDGCDPELTMQPIASEWPLDLPSDEQIELWKELPKLAHSCLNDDFFVYSMNCLRDWEHAVSKPEMGRWILKRVADEFGYEGSGCERYDHYMLAKYGGGRGKPKWVERIGKKYQWVAMYQLASRLHDHVQRKRDSWTPEPQRTPLILLEERKLDPTLPSDMVGSERDADASWMGASADLRSGEQLPDTEWVSRQEDLPALERLLTVQVRGGQRWRLLVSYPSWGRRNEDTDWNDPYRHVWINVESYLIPKEEIATAYDCLHRRNFFGRWMPGGATWVYGFAGEYPWATPFNTEPEEWHSRGGYGDDLPVWYTPSYNKIAVEWEYDASLSGNFHMIVPARPFFASHDLWWDGRDGYRLVRGRSVFRDPSVTEGGPASLIADADDLLERLNKLGFRLIWTLLGEKLILGGPHDKPTPRRTFSQIARLEEDGSMEIGERVFFDDYDQDTGPLRPKGKRRGRGS